MIEILQSKIHKAVVTDANINYEGSITISADLIKLVGLYEFQKVLVVDINNGQRFETYVIETADPNVICLNGAAARLVTVGDLVIIMAFAPWLFFEHGSHLKAFFYVRQSLLM